MQTHGLTLQQAESEVAVLTLLRGHPHVVILLGVTRSLGDLNVFTEWMAGGSIAGLLERHGAFSERVIARFLAQILVGLDYVHGCGIVHRDIKGKAGGHMRVQGFEARTITRDQSSRRTITHILYSVVSL